MVWVLRLQVVPAVRGIAAVDPDVIPLGTRLFIPGYGEAIAADTGGAIIGNKIDLVMDSYGEAMEFGRQDVTVYVFRLNYVKNTKKDDLHW